MSNFLNTAQFSGELRRYRTLEFGENPGIPIEKTTFDNKPGSDPCKWGLSLFYLDTGIPAGFTYGGLLLPFSRQDEYRRPPKIPRGFFPSTPGRPSGRHISGFTIKVGAQAADQCSATYEKN